MQVQIPKVLVRFEYFETYPNTCNYSDTSNNFILLFYFIFLDKDTSNNFLIIKCEIGVCNVEVQVWKSHLEIEV